MAPIYKISLSPPAAAIVNDDTVVLLWGPFISEHQHSARGDKELLAQDTLHMVFKANFNYHLKRVPVLL